MGLKTLATALGSNANSAVVDIEDPIKVTAIVQLDYGTVTAGLINIQGRLSSEYPWTTLFSFDAASGSRPGSKTIDAMPQIRVNTNTLTGGTIPRVGVYI